MKYLKQFGVIILLSFVGEILHFLIPLPVPASIYGIVILLAGLEKKWIPLSAVEETGKFLVEIMPVMFIPAAVGLLESWGALKSVFVPYLLITVLTTCIVMAVTGSFTQAMLHRKNEKGNTKNPASGVSRKER